MKYFVQYQVEGAGLQKAGPYDESEADAQLKDIAGYEGISNASLIPASDLAEPAKFLEPVPQFPSFQE